MTTRSLVTVVGLLMLCFTAHAASAQGTASFGVRSTTPTNSCATSSSLAS